MKRIIPAYILILIFTSAFTGCKMDLYTWPAIENLSDMRTNTISIDQEQEGFQYRVPVTIDNSAYAESFSDFPVLVKLEGSKDVVDNLIPDPGFHDVRFYTKDLEHRLSFEVEKWDPAGGECLLWVKVPSIQAGVNPAAEFYMYYNYEGSDPLPDYPTDVWTDGFLGVWHMNETSGTVYHDSTTRGKHAVSGTDGFVRPTPTEGRIGGGQKYTANPADYSSCGLVVKDLSSSNLGPVTFSLWLEADEKIAGSRFFSKGDGADTRIDVYTKSGATRLDTEIKYDKDPQLLGMMNVLDGTYGSWTWHAVSWDGKKDTGGAAFALDGIRYFKNGSYIGGSRGNQDDGNEKYLGDVGTPLIIGNAGWNDTGQSGVYDEFRVSSVLRTRDWMAAQYLSMTDSYLTFGAEEPISD